MTAADDKFCDILNIMPYWLLLKKVQNLKLSSAATVSHLSSKSYKQLSLKHKSEIILELLQFLNSVLFVLELLSFLFIENIKDGWIDIFLEIKILNIVGICFLNKKQMVAIGFKMFKQICI